MFIFLVFLTDLNALIFIFLSFIHVYWAAGGRWGKDSAVPVNDHGGKLFIPGAGGTLIVAAGLLIFAMINLSICVLPGIGLYYSYLQYGIPVIGLIFLLRAVGDFKYVGFFKKHKTSDFAKMDTLFYAPLCFLFSMTHALISCLFL
ncbi:DUF3995 domain-containing protein [Pedobacter sp. PAMC26386]|nr:DUF3995 domain-containing protein [Pedobacter sp. PAMC26386]